MIEKSWSNVRFNQLGHVLETSLDPGERRQAYERMLDIFEWDDPAAIILFNNSLFYGLRSQLHWTPYPAHNMDFGAAAVTAG